MSDPVRYFRATKIEWVTNPVSGHSWPVHIPLKSFEVAGGGFHRSRHPTEEAAIKEVEEREAFREKYGYANNPKGV